MRTKTAIGNTGKQSKLHDFTVRMMFNAMGKRRSVSDLEAQIRIGLTRPRVQLDIENVALPSDGVFDYTFDFTFE
jgi:hypothetical protein